MTKNFFFAGVAAAACYPCEQLFGLTACAAAGISEPFSYFLRELNFSSSSPSSWGFFLLLPAAKTRTIVKSSRWAAAFPISGRRPQSRWPQAAKPEQFFGILLPQAAGPDPEPRSFLCYAGNFKVTLGV
jgi:hypothetical protein